MTRTMNVRKMTMESPGEVKVTFASDDTIASTYIALLVGLYEVDE